MGVIGSDLHRLVFTNANLQVSACQDMLELIEAKALQHSDLRGRVQGSKPLDHLHAVETLIPDLCLGVRSTGGV